MNNTKPSSIRKLLVAALLSLATSAPADARLVQIIHTNDLHSHLEHAEDKNFGGYAAVKATIDALRNEAATQGIESIVLDAGDFSEGSQYYLAEKGEAVWRTLDVMGYDAVTIGNHDWLAGHGDLDRIVKKVQPSFKLLGANFIFDNKYKNLLNYLKPHAEFTRSGLRIAVLGLTTDEFVFNWRADDGFIWDAESEAQSRLPELRRNNDIVIALTHIGVMKDINLVRKTAGIDIVVGGHSHTRLSEPVYIIDKRGQRVPIVQAGRHGEHVGDLLVDIEPDQPARVIRYRLVPVNANGPKDEAVQESVRQARLALEREYGREWLNEVIGYSEVPIISPENAPTVWSQFTIDSMREAGEADIAIDVDKFYGLTMPAGPVTREQLFEFYPRVFEFNRYGWTIFTSQVRGWAVKVALEQAIKRGWWLNTSGLTYETYYQGTEQKVRNIRVGGKPLKKFKKYRLALPEGIGRATIEIAPIFKTIFKKARDTKIPIWFAMEDKLRRTGTVRPIPLR